jgi:hypothetical protein
LVYKKQQGIGKYFGGGYYWNNSYQLFSGDYTNGFIAKNVYSVGNVFNLKYDFMYVYYSNFYISSDGDTFTKIYPTHNGYAMIYIYDIQYIDELDKIMIIFKITGNNWYVAIKNDIYDN